MPTYGKIYSFPPALQNATSEMLEAGETEQAVADWLNTELTKLQLAGFPPNVTQQNVSAWSLRGHRKWIEDRKTRKLADRIAKLGNIADPTAPDAADNLAAALVAELAIELAYVKQNFEPGEERMRLLLAIASGLVNLRRSNQGKGWLRVEVAKTKMAVAKYQKDNPLAEDMLEDAQRQRGISEETQKEIEMLMGVEDDENYEYQFSSQEDVRQVKRQMKEALQTMHGGFPKTEEEEKALRKKQYEGRLDSFKKIDKQENLPEIMPCLPDAIIEEFATPEEEEIIDRVLARREASQNACGQQEQ